MVNYVNVKIPDELKKRFEEINTKYNLGYTSFAEIIKEQLRRRFEEIEQTYHQPK